MKKTLTIALFLLTASLTQAAQVTFVFNFDYTGYVACDSTTTTDCISGFALYDVSSTRKKIADIPNPSNTTGLQAISYAQSLTSIGNRSFVAVTKGIDSTGAEIDSIDSNTATVSNKPNPPTNLAAAVK